MINPNYVDGPELKIKELAAERDAALAQNAELVAQVEALQSRVGTAERVEAIFNQAPEISFDDCVKLFPDDLREIRAEAVLVAANSCLFMASINTDDGVVNREICLLEDLEQYAELAKDGDV